LSSLGHVSFIRLGASIVIGVCILAGSNVEATTFIDDSRQVMRQNLATQSDPQAPLFGLETEPVAGGLAAKWRTVKTVIDHEQRVLARCRAQENLSGRRARSAGSRC
jgi:hypothetical protein